MMEIKNASKIAEAIINTIKENKLSVAEATEILRIVKRQIQSSTTVS